MPTETKADTCREAFELWTKGRLDLETREGQYTHVDTARAYAIWCAAWEAKRDA
jgi:hypothetical protein